MRATFGVVVCMLCLPSLALAFEENVDESIKTFGKDSDKGHKGAVTGLAFSPDGVLYGVVPHDQSAGNYDIFTINVQTAETHLLGTYYGPTLSQSLVFTPEGRLFALGQYSDYGVTTTEVAELNPVDGAVIGPVLSFPGDYRGIELVPEPTALALAAVCIALAARRRS